jgi:hypothetical protein
MARPLVETRRKPLEGKSKPPAVGQLRPSSALLGGLVGGCTLELPFHRRKANQIC